MAARRPWWERDVAVRGDPDNLSRFMRGLYNKAFKDVPDAKNDRFVMMMYRNGYSPRMIRHYTTREIVGVRDLLDAYLEDNYGVEFVDIFDWRAYENHVSPQE